MAERKRSNDTSRDTDRVLGEKGEVSHQGSSDGELQRNIGTRDEVKRAFERPGGATRVTKRDEKENDA